MFVQYKHPPRFGARIPMDPNKVPFKAILPLKLKNRGNNYLISYLIRFNIFKNIH